MIEFPESLNKLGHATLNWNRRLVLLEQASYFLPGHRTVLAEAPGQWRWVLRPGQLLVCSDRLCMESSPQQRQQGGEGVQGSSQLHPCPLPNPRPLPQGLILSPSPWLSHKGCSRFGLSTTTAFTIGLGARPSAAIMDIRDSLRRTTGAL